MSRAAVLVFVVAGAVLRAQEPLRVQGPNPATVRLGDTSTIELVVEGRNAEPRPPELPPVDGLQLQSSPASRQSYTFFDGRSMVSSNSVQFTVLVRPLREGKFVIPPIKVMIGNQQHQTGELHLDVVKDMKGDEFGYLEVKIEPPRVYVHEPIRVRVELGVEAGLRPVTDIYNRYRYFDFEVQAPWLGQMEGAETLKTPDLDNPQLMVLNRTLQPAEYDASHERSGRHWQSFVFEKSFLPTRIGKLELPAPLLRYHVLLKEGRVGLFGERTGAQTQNYYVYGKPLAVEVLPIPEAGRPNPYYGAVGRFTVDATLDKDSVKLGSSVKLTLTIRGRGNTEFLRVPELESVPGFHKLGQTEKRVAGSVTVVYDLTPIDPAVHEVPAIGWNFFDTTPGVEQFVAVASRALPLTVKPLEHGETLAALPSSDHKALTPGVDDVFDLRSISAGDGAERRAWPRSRTLGAFAVLLPWCLVLGFAAGRAHWRRRAADVLGARARAAARACASALARGVDPASALAQYLGDRLGVPAAAVIGPDLLARLQQAGLDPALAAEVRAAVDDGVAARYGGSGGLDAAAVRTLVQRLEPMALQRGVGASGLLLLAALLCGSGGRAQLPPLDALAAYRSGDYASAAKAFEAQAAATQDCRHWFNAGNASYRQGDLARALWAYECARLGMPRDPDLLANIALVRTRLELGDQAGEPFFTALAQLCGRCSALELAVLAGLCNLLAATCLLLGWRRMPLRAVGLLAAGGAVLLGVELLWFGPERPPRAIVQETCDLVAEPRQARDLPRLATIKPGVALEVLGRSEAWLLVTVQDRKGYLPSRCVAEVR